MLNKGVWSKSNTWAWNWRMPSTCLEFKKWNFSWREGG